MIKLNAWIFLHTFVVLVDSNLISQKKGVVHWHEEFKCTDFDVLNNMAWWYEYRPNITYLMEKCPSTYNSYLDTYVPMVWDDNINMNYIMDGTEYILGHNEPNHVSQANMSPHEAVLAWSDIESIADGRGLVSPSAAPCGENCLGNRDEWFESFFEECYNRSPPCQINFLATHTYMCNANQVMRQLERLYDNYTLPIWLTEFACGGDKFNELDNLNFMKELLPRLENASFVFRYSWYKARISTDHYVKKSASLLDPDGSSTLTNLGIFYNGFSGTEKVDGVWSVWGDWNECNVSCGLGQRSRLRSCIYPDPLVRDLPCVGESSDTEACNLGPCSVDGVWGQWGEWSACGATCGKSQRSRSRECIFPDNSNKGNDCPDEPMDIEECNIQECPGDVHWGHWVVSQCSENCGKGIRTKARVCLISGIETDVSYCSGISMEIPSCWGRNCKVYASCTWSAWSSWFPCLARCGEGKRIRKHKRWYPTNAMDGDCQGSKSEYSP